MKAPYSRFVLVLGLVLLEILLTQTLLCFNLEPGVALSEEGDDRLYKTIVLHIEHQEIASRTFLYGYKFGSARGITLLTSLAKAFPLLSYENLRFSIGGAFLSETTQLTYSKEEDRRFNKSETGYNLGFFTGIYWQSVSDSWLSYRFGWEMALFPAGIIGGLFLATGRKQFFSFSVGMKI